MIRLRGSLPQSSHAWPTRQGKKSLFERAIGDRPPGECPGWDLPRVVGDQAPAGGAWPGAIVGGRQAGGRGLAVGVARRIAELYQVKVNALLDRAGAEGAYTAAGAAAGAAAAGARGGSCVTVPDAADAARRAEDQAAGLHARAAALREQIKAGRPGRPPPLDACRIQDQLDALARDAAVEEELANIRAQLAPRTGKQPGTRDEGG